jgi:hypothetical protein
MLFTTSTFAETITTEQLREMRQNQLDQAYLNAEAGKIPDGESNGTAVFFPNSMVNKPTQLLASLIWQGKVFNAQEGLLVNKVFGFNLVKAKLSYGPSLLDGKKAVIIDYKETSLLFSPIRDEIRLVAPGLYLGRAYYRSLLFGNIMATNFILDFNN